MIHAPIIKRGMTMNPVEKIDRYTKWKELISEQEKSGLSQTAFCKQNNLAASKFGYYRSVIKSQEKVHLDKKLFSPVQIKNPEPTKSSELKIILPNGFQCIISSAMSVAHLKQLMEALLSC